ncbi:MAG TPA: hypothetical protein VGL25_04100 [Casimicrobiaceae bacterium]|jgi:hypothetical protein
MADDLIKRGSANRPRIMSQDWKLRYWAREQFSLLDEVPNKRLRANLYDKRQRNPRA